MIYHLCSNGIYIRQFKKMMDIYASELNTEQRFLHYRQQYTERDKPDKTYSVWGLFCFFFTLNKEDRIFIHSLSGPILYLILAIFRKKLGQVVWIIWGGDLYFYKIAQSCLKYKIYELFRKYFIKKIGFAIGVPGDINLMREVYNWQGQVLDGPAYPIWDLETTCKEKMGSPIHILLGNSADPSNNHIEALKVLSKFKDQNLQIHVPLSYGDDQAYISKVIREGKLLFGEKFHVLKDFMPYDEYITFIKSIDIMLNYHDRQQAIGNIVYMLSNGAKVYIKSQVTTVPFLAHLGIQVYSAEEIGRMDFENFTYISEETQVKNSVNANANFSPEAVVQRWKNYKNIALEK